MSPHSVLARAGRLRAPVLRLCVILGLVWFCVGQMAGHVAQLKGDVILAALAALSPLQWAGALLATLAAFVAVAGQERAVLSHLGITVHPVAGRRAAMAAAAVSQTVGFGPVVGAVVRKRLLPDLTLRQSAAVSAAITVGFFAGLGLLILGVAATVAHGAVALAVLPPAALALLVLVRRLPAPLRRHLPAPACATRFALWLAVDLLSLALACWIVMPDAAVALAGFAAFLSTFLIALGAGLASGSPAGTGPFEATLLAGLPVADANLVVAGILAFRMAAYALPAVIGGVWALAAPRLAPAAPAALHPVRPAAGWLRRLPRAEVQLALQGEVGLLQQADGTVWMQARRAGVAVFLNDPAAPQGRRTDAAALLDHALHHARATGDTPCLYRAGPRLAAVARRRGLAVLPVAREAVIDPAAFTTAGPRHSGLRRKLRHAEAACVTVCTAAPPALPELAEVAAIWARAHGGERGFSMGRFHPETVARQQIVAARDRDGRLIAFATFHTADGEWVLDLLRTREGLPDGTLYLLVCHAIALARAQGVRRLSLACVPVAGWGLRGPAGRIARRLTARCDGLAQFKSAFRPQWEPRYIAAAGPARLLRAALAIARAVHAPPPRRHP